MVVNIVETLKKWGITEYESRAYLSLLKKSPVTPYEAAKGAGIPTSKIYETLKKLSQKEMVVEVQREGKTLYSPLPEEEFLSRSRFTMEQELNQVEAQLKALQTDNPHNFVWNLDTQGEAIEKARQMVSRAQKTILISGWEEEIRQIRSLLRDKEAQGVKVVTIHFGPIKEEVGLCFYHPIEDTLLAEEGGRSFLTVTDSKEALWGTFKKKGFDIAAYSRNAGFVHLAEDYIKHDIYIMKIVKRFDPELVQTFGERYQFLRDIYQDKEA